MSFHISGLASGLDTSQIISDLMKLERLPYTRLENQKSYLRSEQTIFRNVNTKLSALQTAMADLKYVSTFNLRSAKITDESVVRATTQEGAPSGNYTIEVVQTAKNHSMASQGIVSDITNMANLVFEINNEEIDMSGLQGGESNDEILDYIMRKINSDIDGVKAAIVTVDTNGSKALTLTSDKTGKANEIQLGGNGFAELDMFQTQPADNAIIKVNGLEVVRGTNSINDVVPGVTLDLLKQGATTTLTIGTDGDKVADKIDAFVKAYNDVATFLKDNLSKPADESKMNPLQGDSVLKDISLYMNRIFTDAATDLEAGFRMMSELGLTIDKGAAKVSDFTGKITFDKELFKSKLEESPANVYELFKTTMDNMEERLKVWNSSVDGLVASKIKGYDAEIKLVDDRMIALDNRLMMKEQQLKNQFTAMEVSLTKLKSQQNWLTTQLASLTAMTANNNK